MAQQYSFFNADLVNGQYDRTYNAQDWAEYFASFINTGVSFTPSTSLQVTAGTGMQVILSPGIAFINGYRYANTTPLTVNINPANGTYSRITSVVIELNLSKREITCLTLDGTPSPSPTAPQLTQNTGIYQIQVATVLVQAGATQITQSNITDTRGNDSVCPWLQLLTPENQNAEMQNAITNLENEVSTLQKTAITPNSTAVFTNNIAFTPSGQLSFQNSKNNNIIGFYSQGDSFVVGDLLTNNVALNFALASNNLLLNSYIPTTFNENVIFDDNITINYPVTITEANGEISFENANNVKNISFAVYNNQFVLQNAITNNFIFGVTPVSSGTDTLNFYSNSIFGQNTTFNSNSTFNYPLEITEKNGMLSFKNAAGGNNMNFAVYNDEFVLQNGITNNNIFAVTPVNSGTDNLQFQSNITFNNSANFDSTINCNNQFSITEKNGFLSFQNSNGSNIVDFQVNTNTFALENSITQNVIVEIQPNTIADSIDTVQMYGNANFVNGAAMQINGSQVWNGGNAAYNNSLTGQFAISGSGGEYLTYNIQYWVMDMGQVVNPNNTPTCGIGVITVTLTPNSNFSWSGSGSLSLGSITGLSGLQTMTMGANPQFDITISNDVDSLLINNINIEYNNNSNTPNTYTATALIYA